MTVQGATILGVVLAAASVGLSAQSVSSADALRNEPAAFVELAYPADALATHMTGTVVARAALDADGRVTNAAVLSGPPVFAAAVVDNLRQWTFRPDDHGRAIVVYRFVIELAECNDPSRSFFRVHHRNLATITACQRPDRVQQPRADFDPRVISMARPSYPHIAFSARYGGLVVLEAQIDRRGNVRAVTTLSSRPLLSESAIENLETWRFDVTEPRRLVVVYEFDSGGNHDCSDRERYAEGRLAIDEDGLPTFVRVRACGPLVQVSGQ